MECGTRCYGGVRLEYSKASKRASAREQLSGLQRTAESWNMELGHLKGMRIVFQLSGFDYIMMPPAKASALQRDLIVRLAGIQGAAC